MRVPGVIRNYLLITKPGIVLGNIISATGGFLLASKGLVDMTVLVPTIIGISLVVASACVFNNCVDRKIDRKMLRTRNRALARGLVSPRAALLYALLLAVSGAALLLPVSKLSLAIVVAGFCIYAGAYSLYLKRCSAYGVLIGSLAGAAPPIAGYCAVSHRIDMAALILFAMFVLWQVPHSYAIAIFRLDDYSTASIPLLPVRKGVAAARKHITGYVLAFTVVALMLTLAGYTGYPYLVASAGLGLLWLLITWSGRKLSDNRLWAQRLYFFSILAIVILSAMMSVDFTTSATSTLPPICAR